jgi:hypothetical protein
MIKDLKYEKKYSLPGILGENLSVKVQYAEW